MAGDGAMVERPGIGCGAPWAPDAVLDAMMLVEGIGPGRARGEDVRRVSLRASQIGGSWAREGMDPARELAHLGIEIGRVPGTAAPAPGAPRVSALAVPAAGGRPARVILCAAEIERKFRALRRIGVEVSERDLIALHLAHELYHIIEGIEGVDTPQRAGAVRVRGALGERARHLRSAREVAAHAFARRCCGFPLHPRLVDEIAAIEETDTAFARAATAAGAWFAA